MKLRRFENLLRSIIHSNDGQLSDISDNGQGVIGLYVSDLSRLQDGIVGGGKGKPHRQERVAKDQAVPGYR